MEFNDIDVNLIFTAQIGAVVGGAYSHWYDNVNKTS
jgi:hypothetical protein